MGRAAPGLQSALAGEARTSAGSGWEEAEGWGKGKSAGGGEGQRWSRAPRAARRRLCARALAAVLVTPVPLSAALSLSSPRAAACGTPRSSRHP